MTSHNGETAVGGTDVGEVVWLGRFVDGGKLRHRLMG